MIKPEIGKLSKSLVDRIPLVMYIPPPPSGSPLEKITPPASTYSYPPKPTPQSTPSTTTRPRFKFIRRFRGKKRKGSTDSPAQSTDDETLKEPQTWEAHWEKGEYPFVILEGNRAACAICLMDFEEPKKIGGPISSDSDPPAETAVQDQAEQTALRDRTVTADAIAEEERNNNLKLENAGDGAQPLRLLACGHVFHVSLMALLQINCPDHFSRKHVWILGSLMFQGGVQFARELWSFPRRRIGSNAGITDASIDDLINVEAISVPPAKIFIDTFVYSHH